MISHVKDSECWSVLKEVPTEVPGYSFCWHKLTWMSSTTRYYLLKVLSFKVQVPIVAHLTEQNFEIFQFIQCILCTACKPTYPHKPLRKTELALHKANCSCNACHGVWSGVCNRTCRRKYDVHAAVLTVVQLCPELKFCSSLISNAQHCLATELY